MVKIKLDVPKNNDLVGGIAKKKGYNRHHITYPIPKKQQEVVRLVRDGVHYIITLIRRYEHLNNEEIDTIKLECELKRTYDRS